MTDSHKVLVVEDDLDVRRSISEVLTDEGYRVQEASNGFEALQFLKHTDLLPCLILLDLMMPIMDGWEFRDHQFRDPALSEIPVVVITADVQAVTRLLRPARTLAKPITLDKLLQTVATYC